MIKRLNVNEWFPNEDAYEKAKYEYIANYKIYVSGHSTGLFSWKDGYEKHEPVIAEAKWNACYPNGFSDWRKGEFYIDYDDAKKLEEKINEIIDLLALKKEI